jgi:hypothetical protein
MRGRSPLSVTIGLTLVISLLASPASGQIAAGPRPQIRADLIAGSQPAVQVGAGLQVPLGIYVRAGLDAAVGSRIGEVSTSSRLDGRVDLLARFLLDPFRQSRWGFSAGGGLSVRAEPGERLRPLLLVALDLEGRRSLRGVAPAVQIGLGGGLRLGAILRRVPAASR